MAHRLLRIWLLVACLGAVSRADDARTLFQPHVFTHGQQSLPYRMMVPEGFSADAQSRWPLVVFLHGAGERGDDNVAQLVHGMNDFAKEANRKNFPCFVVAPQCPKEQRWVEVDWTLPRHDQPAEPSSPLALVMELIPALKKQFPIDDRRVYLTGLSMGGFGTWDLLARQPDWFAAAVPVCGGADEKTAQKLAKIPVWTFHGDQDTVVIPERSRTMVAALQAAGGTVKHTEYKDVGHNAWARAYSDPDMMRWLFAQKRPDETARTKPAPDFVVILCDDLGYGDLGCYGHPHIKTPRLDRLAEDGLRLTDCYASAPVCSPSRAGLLTGRTPHRAGIYDWIPQGNVMHLRKSETTVAHLLKSAGYATCHVGKWHCNGKFNSPEQPQPGDHGFDHWFSTQNNAAPSHENPVNFVRNGKPVGPLTGYSSTQIVDEAIRWLNQQPAEQAVCLFVWFHAPHEPVATASQYVEPYRQLIASEDQATYFGNVTQMDHEVGRLLDSLEASGRDRNALVLFTSDNGPETLNRYKNAHRSWGTPGPLRGMKLHLHEGGIRVPGIIRWPGRVAVRQTSAVPVSNVDVLPTLCELAGAPLPAGLSVDGTSLKPLLTSGAAPVRQKPLYWQYSKALSRAKVALRDGDWKILSNETVTEFELYNLKDDPSEKHDLAGTQPGKLAELSARLKAFHADVGRDAPVWP